jgi:hypothetical protein
MLEDYKSDLNCLNSLQLFRKYILGNCHILSPQQHLEIREEISANFNVEFQDVIIVGSGKLGFSIKPSKRYMAFCDESDIDVAIVSTKLFEKVWEETYKYEKSKADWPESTKFFSYLSKGWIRPDKLPKSQYFTFTDVWWNFFNELTISKKYGPYKIRAGLYYSNFFLQEYQMICIEQCIEDFRNGYIGFK